MIGRIIAWLSVGTRGFDIAMMMCMPPLIAVVVIGMVGNG